MSARQKHKVVVAETHIPGSQKMVRLTFDAGPLLDTIRQKNFDNTGRRDSENQIFAQALYDYAVALLGKDEVERCLKMK